MFARTGQDLKVALSEFQPGKRLTINKQSFLVEGVGVSFPENPINHVESFEFEKQRYNPMNPSEFYDGAEEWRYFHRCEADNCGYILQQPEPIGTLTGQNPVQIAKQFMIMMEFYEAPGFSRLKCFVLASCPTILIPAGTIIGQMRGRIRTS